VQSCSCSIQLLTNGRSLLGNAGCHLVHGLHVLQTFQCFPASTIASNFGSVSDIRSSF
jgi:hypothetical protein